MVNQQVPRMSKLFQLEYPQSVGIYTSYEEAQKVVDFLADSRFPVENLAIVGTDLKSIERVLGRRSWGTVLSQGAQSGLSTGLMLTFLFWLFMPTQEFWLTAVYAIGIGVLVGVVMSVIAYWMSQGKRDFTSISQTIATRYEILAEHQVAGKARELIATLPGARMASFGAPVPPYPAAPMPSQYQTPMPGVGYPPPMYPPLGYPYPGYPMGGYPPPTYQPVPTPPEAAATPQQSDPGPSDPAENPNPEPAPKDSQGD